MNYSGWVRFNAEAVIWFGNWAWRCAWRTGQVVIPGRQDGYSRKKFCYEGPLFEGLKQVTKKLPNLVFGVTKD